MCVVCVYLCVFVPLYLVTTVELRHCGSWKVTVSVVLLLTLRRTIDGASGAPEQGHKFRNVKLKLTVSRSDGNVKLRRLCVFRTRVGMTSDWLTARRSNVVRLSVGGALLSSPALPVQSGAFAHCCLGSFGDAAANLRLLL